ncbi:cytochrome P450 [Streptomyces albiaxialis]
MDGLDLAEAYGRAQRTGGLTRVRMPYGEPAWLATRYADARAVLGDPRFSRAMARTRDAPRTTPVEPLGIVSMDPPEHTRVRGLVARAFTARRAEGLRPRVRGTAEAALLRMRGRGAPADLVEDFALPVPITVICELLGVPDADRARFRGWSEAVLSTSGATPEEFGRATAALKAYMTELIALRGAGTSRGAGRAEPSDDLLTALARARDDDGGRLGEDELAELGIALLLGGYETTASQLANFTYTLLTERPGELARLREDPGAVASWTEELLRYVPLAASASLPRYATEDLDIGGTRVRAREPVLVAIGAANRDALRYPAPAALDPARDSRAHLAFGHGIHRCVGAALARVELQESLLALARLLPGLRLDAAPEWKTAAFLRGPTTLPVRW